MQRRKRRSRKRGPTPARDGQVCWAWARPASGGDRTTAPPCIQTSPTSRASGGRIRQDAGRLEVRVLDALRDAGREGLTDAEIEEVTGLGGNTARPRRVRLVELAHVIDSGRRRRTTSGRLATVWICAEFVGVEEAA